MKSLLSRAAALSVVVAAVLLPLIAAAPAGAASICAEEEAAVQASAAEQHEANLARKDFRVSTLLPAREAAAETQSTLGAAQDELASKQSSFLAARQAYQADRNPSTRAVLDTAREQRDQARIAVQTAKQGYLSAVATRAQAEVDFDALVAHFGLVRAGAQEAQQVLDDCLALTGVGARLVTGSLDQFRNVVTGSLIIYGLSPSTQYYVSNVNECTDFGAPPGPGCVVPAFTDADGHWHAGGRHLGQCGTSSNEFRVYQLSAAVNPVATLTVGYSYQCQ